MHLKPCPFCGSHDVEVEFEDELGSHVYCVACQECGTVGPMGHDDDEAIEAWNTRAQKADQ